MASLKGEVILKRLVIILIVVFINIILISTPSYGENNIPGNNNTEYTDKKIEEMKKDFQNKIDSINEKVSNKDEQNKVLIDVLKTNLDEANSKNNYLISFFDVVIAIIGIIGAVILGGLSILGIKVNNLWKKSNDTLNDVVEKQNLAEASLTEVETKINESNIKLTNVGQALVDAQAKLGEFNAIKEQIETQAELTHAQIKSVQSIQTNVSDKLEGLTNIINVLETAINNFKENVDYKALESDLATAATLVNQLSEDEKDENDIYVDLGEKEEKEILNLKLKGKR
jgi:Tfp pilus assembly protein PilX